VQCQTYGYVSSHSSNTAFLAGTKLYCLVTEAHVCKQLARGCYLAVSGSESYPRSFDHKSDALSNIKLFALLECLFVLWTAFDDYYFVIFKDFAFARF